MTRVTLAKGAGARRRVAPAVPLTPRGLCACPADGAGISARPECGSSEVPARPVKQPLCLKSGNGNSERLSNLQSHAAHQVAGLGKNPQVSELRAHPSSLGPAGWWWGGVDIPEGAAGQPLSSQPRIPDLGQTHPAPRPTVPCHLASPCPCPHPAGVGESWP